MAVRFRGAALLACCLGWATASGVTSALPAAAMSPGATSPSAAATPPSVAPAESAAANAFLRVETEPTGLQVMVDGAYVGRSPIDSLAFPPKAVDVRVLGPDLRRFDGTRDEARVSLKAGATVTVFLDVRPSILLRSEPEPASVILTNRPGDLPDSLLGETPLSVTPASMEGAELRFALETFADTVLSAATLVDSAGGGVRVALRRSSTPLPTLGPASRTPLYRRGWFRWSLVGVGAALSGAAVVFHNQGDDWYDRYLASSDVRKIPDLYDRAVRNDHLAVFSVATGQICLIGGLVLLLTGQSR